MCFSVFKFELRYVIVEGCFLVTIPKNEKRNVSLSTTLSPFGLARISEQMADVAKSLDEQLMGIPSKRRSLTLAVMNGVLGLLNRFGRALFIMPKAPGLTFSTVYTILCENITKLLYTGCEHCSHFVLSIVLNLE